MSTMREIAEEVASEYGLTLDQIRSEARGRPVAWPRQEAMWRMREVRLPTGEHRYSTTQIGLYLGGRDHTTVIHGIRRHKERMANEQSPRKIESTCGKVGLPQCGGAANRGTIPA